MVIEVSNEEGTIKEKIRERIICFGQEAL